MYYSTIKWTDIANGSGVRLSLFVSGCPHHCVGCFNEETWDYENGALYTPQIQEDILYKLGASYLQGFSLLGGEPLCPPNQSAVANLLQGIRQRYPKKDVWCYSGYRLEELDPQLGGWVLGEYAREILPYIDILVDGKFIQEEKNLNLFFRGSENQRILDLQQSLLQGEPVIIPDKKVIDFSINRSFSQL